MKHETGLTMSKKKNVYLYKVIKSKYLVLITLTEYIDERKSQYVQNIINWVLRKFVVTNQYFL
jgi:hypothetical protein